MSFIRGSLACRIVVAIQIIFALIVFVVSFGLPESPRWLVTKGCDAEAVEVLCLVYKEQEIGPEVSFQIQQIKDAMELERQSGGFKWAQIFKKDNMQTGKRILLAWGVQLSYEYVCYTGRTADLRPVHEQSWQHQSRCLLYSVYAVPTPPSTDMP